MSFTAKQIDDLDTFFQKAKLPATIQLHAGSKIENLTTFIESHLNVLRANPEKHIYDVFFDRLVLLKQLISG